MPMQRWCLIHNVELQGLDETPQCPVYGCGAPPATWRVMQLRAGRAPVCLHVVRGGKIEWSAEALPHEGQRLSGRDERGFALGAGLRVEGEP